VKAVSDLETIVQQLKPNVESTKAEVIKYVGLH